MPKKDGNNIDIEPLIEYIGGNTRYYLILFAFYLKLKKTKPIKQDFFIRSSIDEDYYGYTNNRHRNSIVFVIIMFIVFSVLGKISKVVF